MRSWKVAAAITLAVGGLLSTTAPAAPATPGVPVLQLDGRGHGHGVGMSQWGAERMAREARSADEILQTFYPGTSIGEAGGLVRVAVHQAPGAVTLAFPHGGEVRSGAGGDQPPGFPVRVGPGGQVRVRPDGAGFAVEPLVQAASGRAATTYSGGPAPAQQSCSIPVLCPPDGGDAPDDTTGPEPAPSPAPAPAPAPTPPPGDAPPPADPAPGPAPADPPPPQPHQPQDGAARTGATVWAVPSGGSPTTVLERGRTYRGALEVLRAGEGLRVLNQLDIETYLTGIAEVPGSWPAAALEAQAVAARTYALRAMQSSGEICDSQRCQVYVGVDGENPGQNAAIEATRGRVLTFGGALAAAVYSADAGGVSATTLEGFGTPDGAYPYLTTVHYGESGPAPWGVEVALSDVAARVGYAGRIEAVRVADAGPSGRALSISIEGDAGPLTVDGRRFASVLGLRSTLFTVATAVAGEAPEAPPAVELQALPEAPGATGPSGGVLPAFEAAGRAGATMAAMPVDGSWLAGAGDIAARLAAGRWAVLALAAVTALAVHLTGGTLAPAGRLPGAGAVDLAAVVAEAGDRARRGVRDAARATLARWTPRR
jgi:stage II sporulation protein D